MPVESICVMPPRRGTMAACARMPARGRMLSSGNGDRPSMYFAAKPANDMPPAAALTALHQSCDRPFRVIDVFRAVDGMDPGVERCVLERHGWCRRDLVQLFSRLTEEPLL